MLIDCQYCFLPFDNCTCCIHCSSPKGTCSCHLEGEYPCTKCHPSDIYKALNTLPGMCVMFAGIETLEDCDKHIMKMFKKECWPERLKHDN